MHDLRPEAVLDRLDDNHVRIRNPQGVPVTLLANRDVPLEMDAVEQLLGFVSIQDTLARLAEHDRRGPQAPFFGDSPGALRRVVVTPDFHRGSGIPVGTVAEAAGFVVPQAVGSDVCCGMRLLATDVTRNELERILPALAGPLRAVFFQGQREIPMSPRQREAVLKEGLFGLVETAADNAGKGTWAYFDAAVQEAETRRVHFQGVLPARGLHSFADYVRGSGRSDGRDAQIGSVGGGNHFVEIQTVEELFDGPTADAFGLRPGAVTIMAHSGSVGLGHAVGGYFSDEARALYPKELPHPDHGFWILPTGGPHAALAARYLDAMRNAANFAFANRLFLGLMAVRVLSERLGRRVSAQLVYDAPHNLIWEPAAPGQPYLHRKGACPASGPEPTGEGPFRYTGHPVIIPGSMGAASFVLAGAGRTETLESACHGAGRSLSRGRSTHVDDDQFDQAMEPLRVVTPIDPESYEVRSRRDILAKYRARLKEEAPYAYKDITPVVQTIEDAGVARRVARLWPRLTIKG